MRAQRRTIDEIKKKKKWRTIITIQKQVTIPSKSYLSFDSSNLFLRLSRNSIRLVPNVIFLSDDSLQLKKKKTLVSNCTFPFLEVRSSVAIGYSFVQKTRENLLDGGGPRFHRVRAGERYHGAPWKLSGQVPCCARKHISSAI